MLSTQDREVIKSTIPVVRKNMLPLMREFYSTLFDENPHLKKVFNMSHQKDESQLVSLGETIIAYAENIDNPQVLLPRLKEIAEKHVIHQVQMDHYPIVGDVLLRTIRKVLLNGEANTKIEIVWGRAYNMVADILIDLEQQLYQSLANHGWAGYRDFTVINIVEETTDICSFVLEATDGNEVLDFTPGQYVGVRIEGIDATRIYSLSNKPGTGAYRITVKRDGLFSEHMFNSVDRGDTIQLHAPLGRFKLPATHNEPLVLVTAGIGVTPIMSMVEYLCGQAEGPQVIHIHCDQNSNSFAFHNALSEYNAINERYTLYPVYRSPLEGDSSLCKRLTGPDIMGVCDSKHSNFFVCGSNGFKSFIDKELTRLGVDESKLNYEYFGSRVSLHQEKSEEPAEAIA